MENRIAVGLVMTREHKGTTLYRGRGEVVDKIALCSETHTSFKSKLVRERPEDRTGSRVWFLTCIGLGSPAGQGFSFPSFFTN